MKRFALPGLLVVVLAALGVYLVGFRTTVPTAPNTDERESDASYVSQLPISPLEATYRIDDQEVTLSDGKATVPSAPGSAAREEVRVWGEPVFGDIDGNGRDDAVILLTKQGGGSGTFYYVAVALGAQDGYVGLNAVYIGDRVAPQNVLVRDELVVVNYADRPAGQPFTEQPSVGVSAYLLLVGTTLTRVDISGEGSAVLSGHIIYGHEARTFKPCGGEAYWIATSSRSRAALEAVYSQATRGKEPYSPIYAVIVGTVGEAPTDGFGAEYPYSIDIQQLLAVPEKGACTAPATPQGE